MTTFNVTAYMLVYTLDLSLLFLPADLYWASVGFPSLLPCRPVSAAVLGRGAAKAGAGAAIKPAERRKERRRRSSSKLPNACGKSKVLAAAALSQVKMALWSGKQSACDKRSVKSKVLAAAVRDQVKMAWQSKRPSACDKKSVKNKVLAAAVRDQVKMAWWSRRPSACDKKSVKNKVPASEVLAQVKEADQLTVRRWR